jgi:hypothetical protein
MNIIDDINNKVSQLVNLGLTDENKVRRALTIAITENPDRNPQAILQQQFVLMQMKFYGGDTRYVKGE